MKRLSLGFITWLFCLSASLAQVGNSGVSTIDPRQGVTWNQPADISCSANTVCDVTTLAGLSTSHKYISVTNVTGSGYCRVTYGGVTPSLTRGDPVGPAQSAGGQGGASLYGNSYVPPGAVAAMCSVDSKLAVAEGN